MVVGVCKIDLHFPESGSLKEKRHGLRRILDRTRGKFNVALAEVGELDTWQRSTIAFSVVGNDGQHVQSMLDNILAFIEQLYVAHILDHQIDLLHYNDDEPIGG